MTVKQIIFTFFDLLKMKWCDNYHDNPSRILDARYWIFKFQL